MFVYTIGDVLFFVFIIVVVGLVVGGYLLACVLTFVAYICEGVVWIFNRLFGGKGNM